MVAVMGQLRPSGRCGNVSSWLGGVRMAVHSRALGCFPRCSRDGGGDALAV